jgi:DNA repair photolyase
MKLIYEPSGKAREYSPLALNVYTGGCDHQCDYCYCRFAQRGNWGPTARPRILTGLKSDAQQASRQILLSFISDPYCLAETTHRNTRKALDILGNAGCSVAILTKGGSRCLDDLTLFKSWPGGRVKVGASLTCSNDSDSLKHEPGAALPKERLETLRTLHKAGIQTWASFEPVLDTRQSLELLEASLPFVDIYKVGKLNHDSRSKLSDWKSFGMAATEMLRKAGKVFYIKHDLQLFMPCAYLSEQERDTETVTLPDRPAARELF